MNITLATTNLIKVGGLVVFLYEIFGKPTPQPLGMAIAAFAMAGAQFSEDTLIRIVKQMFVSPESSEGSDTTKKSHAASRGTSGDSQ